MIFEDKFIASKSQTIVKIIYLTINLDLEMIWELAKIEVAITRRLRKSLQQKVPAVGNIGSI